MYKIISILLLLITTVNCYSQKQEVKIGLVTRNVDTTFTHLYVDVVRTLNKLNPHPFNLLDYYHEKLNESLPDSNLVITKVDWQTLYNKFNFYNLVGKPSKKCSEWLRILYESEGIDYIIFLDGSKTISPNYNMILNSNSYGIATYYISMRTISIYSVVYPSIFSTNPVGKI